MYKFVLGQFLILLGVLSWSGDVTASVKTRTVDLPTKWGTFRAEIHYRQWEWSFADRVEAVLRNDCGALFDYFRYVPRDIVHFSTQQEASSANGLATVAYGNRIVLNNHPPLGPGHLSYNGDWVQMLVIHELTHVIHMDQTRGVPNGFRTFLGFYGKWNGIAPSWFLEGVAVWAESQFTDGGRLRNKKMRYEFDASLFDPESCSSIDCLDDPGRYPYGQYAYWAGAYFIEYLEDNFPGTIRCLVTENSYYFPGFLGRVFKNCLNLPAGGLYQLFRQKRMQELTKMSLELPSLKELYYQRGGEIIWQRGHTLLGNRLFAVERDLAREHLVEIDLESGLRSQFDFDYLIEHLPKLSHYSTSKELIPLTLFTVSGGDYVRHGELWKARKQKSIGDVDFEQPRRAHYLFLLSDKQKLILENDNESWRLLRDKKLIAALPRLESLSSPLLIELEGREQLLVRSFCRQKGYRLLMHSLKERSSWRVVYHSKEPFELFDRLEEGILLQTASGDLEKIIIKNNEVTINQYRSSWTRQVVELSSNKGQLVVLLAGKPGKIFVGKSKNFEQDLSRSRRSSRVFKSYLLESQRSISKNIAVEESYPSLRHFIPQGQLFFWESGTKSSYYGASTTVMDPRRHHTFFLMGQYFDGYQRFAPTLSYQYNWRGRDRLLLFGSYGEDYSWSSYQGRMRKERTAQAYIGWRLPFGRWEDFWLLSVSREDFDNFSQMIIQKKYAFQKSLSYRSLFENAFIHDFNFVGMIEQYEVADFDKFYGVELKSNLGLRFHRRFNLNLVATWGRYYKEDDSIASGFLEAGDKEDTFYHLYGVEYSDVFGLKMAIGSARFDWNLLEIYRGAGLFPLYLKQVNLFWGVDRFKAQYLYLNSHLYQDSTFSTAHVGLRFKGVLGFYLPCILELSYARVLEFHDEGVGAIRFGLGI